jgi:arabinose-5-phosphate isomerase
MEENPTIKQARDVLKIEAESILELIDKIGDNFVRAVNIIYKSKGRVIVTGIGKSGLIGKKIVATLTSSYAVQPSFSDGHDSGLYSWDYLYELGMDHDQLWQQYLQRMQAAGASREPGLTPAAPIKSGCH